MENQPTSKRKNPHYIKITGDVEKEVAAKVKAVCALSDIPVSEALNEGMKLWLAEREKVSDFEIQFRSTGKN